MPVFGYELEFAAKRNFYADFSNSFAYEHFYCGTDESADTVRNGMYFYGFELITNKITGEFPVEKFKRAISLIKKCNGLVHKKCGFHIHFSGYGELTDLQFELLYFKLMKLKRWKSRDQWCERHVPRSFPHYKQYKYKPLRQVDGDHYEVRVFNGSLNLRALANYDRKTKSLIQEVLDN